MRKKKYVGKSDMMRIGGINTQNENEAGEVNGKFDENSKLKIPKVKKSATELLKGVDNPKMDKEIAKVELKGKPKNKEPWMNRNHFDDGKAFVERCKKELGLTVKMMKVNNKKICEEPLLIHKSGRKVAWIAPRVNQRFGVYVFNLEGREIHKIVTPEDMKKEFDIIAEIVKQIDLLSSQKIRRATKGSRKRKSKISPTKPRTIFEIEEQIQRLSKRSNAIHIKIITPTIRKWAEEKGYTWTGDDGKMLRVRELPDQ